MTDYRPPGLGCPRDHRDYRDYTVSHPRVAKLMSGLLPSPAELPSRVDLRSFDGEGAGFSPVRNQFGLNSSSAHGCVALFEYFQRRVRGDMTQLSVHFVYKVSRRAQQLSGNVGIDLRSTLKAVARFGIPTEAYWPDDISSFDEEPDAFAYSYAMTTINRRRLVYFRPAEPEMGGETVLANIKRLLSVGIPLLIGFSVPSWITNSATIRFRPANTGLLGGHAVVAVGYDDAMVCDGISGAICFRNSWGDQWGENGYGWLPYEFVRRELINDVWVVIRKDWLRGDCFYHPFRTEEVVE